MTVRYDRNWTKMSAWCWNFANTANKNSMPKYWFEVPIRVAARSEAWVCGRSPAGIAGSNPAGACRSVSCEGWVLSGTGLCVGLVTRSVLPRAMCLSAIVKPWQWGGPGPLGAVEPWKNHDSKRYIIYKRKHERARITFSVVLETRMHCITDIISFLLLYSSLKYAITLYTFGSSLLK
jgi:hypothetical protein